MIRVNSVKLNIHYTDADIRAALCKKLRINDRELLGFSPVKLSLDARKKDDIFYVLSCDVTLTNEAKVLNDKKVSDVLLPKEIVYKDPLSGHTLKDNIKFRPIIVGFGPAGMFSALMLARAGLKPLVLERGNEVT